MDWIWLYGIECRVHLGVPSQERRRAQKVLVDVGVQAELSAAAAKDDLRLSVDYRGIEEAVRAAAEAGERRLLEALAGELARLVLSRDRRIRAARLILHKKPSVMPRTREVVVDILRRRGE